MVSANVPTRIRTLSEPVRAYTIEGMLVNRIGERSVKLTTNSCGERRGMRPESMSGGESGIGFMRLEDDGDIPGRPGVIAMLLDELPTGCKIDSSARLRSDDELPNVNRDDELDDPNGAMEELDDAS